MRCTRKPAHASRLTRGGWQAALSAAGVMNFPSDAYKGRRRPRPRPTRPRCNGCARAWPVAPSGGGIVTAVHPIPAAPAEIISGIRATPASIHSPATDAGVMNPPCATALQAVRQRPGQRRSRWGGLPQEPTTPRVPATTTQVGRATLVGSLPRPLSSFPRRRESRHKACIIRWVNACRSQSGGKPPHSTTHRDALRQTWQPHPNRDATVRERTPAQASTCASSSNRRAISPPAAGLPMERAPAAIRSRSA